jgi:glycosyltransferase involved in cell wall biosynthesis
VECIVVDDGSESPDATKYATGLAASDPLVRVVRHQSRCGLPAARNTGLALATGSYVTFLDDDDYLCSQAMQRRAQSLGKRPQTSVGVYGDWISLAPRSGLDHFVTFRRAAARLDVEFSKIGWTAPFIASAPLCRTDVLRMAGGFNESLDRGEDVEFWFRLTRLGYIFAYERKIVVGYRRSPGLRPQVNSWPGFAISRHG